MRPWGWGWASPAGGGPNALKLEPEVGGVGPVDGPRTGKPSAAGARNGKPPLCGSLGPRRGKPPLCGSVGPRRGKPPLSPRRVGSAPPVRGWPALSDSSPGRAAARPPRAGPLGESGRSVRVAPGTRTRWAPNAETPGGRPVAGSGWSAGLPGPALRLAAAAKPSNSPIVAGSTDAGVRCGNGSPPSARTGGGTCLGAQAAAGGGGGLPEAGTTEGAPGAAAGEPNGDAEPATALPATGGGGALPDAGGTYGEALLPGAGGG